MTETIEESLLDNLLKSRYPLTHYLNRQQEFIKLLSTTQINAVPTPSESDINVMCKRKTPLPSRYNIPDTIDPQASEFNGAQNEINSDQADNPGYDQSPEIDDNATQEYDEKPLLKSINEKNASKQ